jgi:hypothetical protein
MDGLAMEFAQPEQGPCFLARSRTAESIHEAKSHHLPLDRGW